jgi:hypothetical protein
LARDISTEKARAEFIIAPVLVLDHPSDLVDLDTPDAFAQHLQKEGVLLRVG